LEPPEADALLVEPDAIADGWLAEDEDWLAEADAAGWLADDADWLADADFAGWLADDAGWLAEAVAAGWLVDADVCLSLSVFAITVPAAMRAATRASFLNMVGFLSDGQLTAIRFGARRARKFHEGRTPGDARHSADRRGGWAT
jgi:hypothetical protein